MWAPVPLVSEEAPELAEKDGSRQAHTHQQSLTSL